MQKFHLAHYFLVLNFFLGTCNCISLKTEPTTSCGKIKIQPPFLKPNYQNGSFPLNHMILCRSQKLYFRTSIGLFPISSIDYKTKTLIISHSSSSSSSSSIHFVSPSILSSGFPSPKKLINSLLLFHCSNIIPTKSCSHLLKQDEEEIEPIKSCLIVDDVGKLNKGFHPKDMKCSNYKRVYRRRRRRRSSDELRKGYKIGTTISFDIPEHVPNICNECEKPNGHCGVGLRCICHVLECKDKVFSKGGIINPDGKILISLFTVLVLIL